MHIRRKRRKSESRVDCHKLIAPAHSRRRSQNQFSRWYFRCITSVELAFGNEQKQMKSKSKIQKKKIRCHFNWSKIFSLILIRSECDDIISNKIVLWPSVAIDSAAAHIGRNSRKTITKSFVVRRLKRNSSKRAKTVESRKCEWQQNDDDQRKKDVPIETTVFSRRWFVVTRCAHESNSRKTSNNSEIKVNSVHTWTPFMRPRPCDDGDDVPHEL